jgi:uncharacterized protein (DUF983 family)
MPGAAEMTDIANNDGAGAWLSAGRAAFGRCPNCGKAPLFRAYLKQVDACAACGESYAHIRADDGPAWLTILVVGHIVVGLILAIEPYTTWASWTAVLVWSCLTIAMTLALLPAAKGIFISILRRTGAPGSGEA